MPKSELTDIACAVVRQTERAILIDDGARREWVPKQYAEVNEDGTVTLPEWLAIEKGFV